MHKKLLAVLLLAIGSAFAADVSLGIRIGPPPRPRVVRVRPAAPGPGFMWVDGYWYVAGTRYKWHDGYWSRPPYESGRWVAPHHDGSRFFEGYWDGDRGRRDHDHRWDKERDRRDYDRR